VFLPFSGFSLDRDAVKPSPPVVFVSLVLCFFIRLFPRIGVDFLAKLRAWTGITTTTLYLLCFAFGTLGFGVGKSFLSSGEGGSQ